MMVDEMEKPRMQQIMDECRRLEKESREISNADLKRQLRHRTHHRGEKFVVDGRTKALNGKTVKATMRNEYDSRMYRTLGDPRVNAMMHVHVAFKMLTAGLGVKTFNPERIPGGMSAAKCAELLRVLYFQWAHICQIRKLDHAMCIDVIGLGLTPHEVDLKRGQGNGRAYRNLEGCLDAAIEVGLCNILKDEG